MGFRLDITYGMEFLYSRFYVKKNIIFTKIKKCLNKMTEWFSNNRFNRSCDRIRLTDGLIVRLILQSIACPDQIHQIPRMIVLLSLSTPTIYFRTVYESLK